MSSWTKSFRKNEATIRGQMAAAVKLALAAGIPVEEAMAPYLDMLRDSYEEDFPLVRVIDESDLVTRFDGPEMGHDNPPAGTVAHVLGSLQDHVVKLALSIAGLSGVDAWRGKTPDELDPRLAGITKGSIIVGIKFGEPATRKGQLNLPISMEEIVKSVRSAVRKLPIVPGYIDADRISEGLNERLTDPAERDAILVAASRIAPTGHHGINEVNFLSQKKRSERLTPHSRQIIKQAIAQPAARVSRNGTFTGTVRSADLDARRFDIRNVSSVGSLRCVYDEKFDELVRDSLDHAVRVTGFYECDGQGKPRLLVANEIVPISAGHKDQPLPF
ncbi:hypothetical protein SAMN04487926_14520 [Paraburkholderia steynii]|uniref:Uncharacterized protein n=1 Tax=Paraburkholderia steynii TaxID=1245441 RepID=A0A7Z7FNC6_9BURK|nr:hypothetical protein [Paraburkholderia steynii]SDJ36245.1 hypothetical protein SAMN04487926_14520 [Paraburkholderia steynii]